MSQSRPGTISQNSSAAGSRTAMRTGTRSGSARNIRLGSASIYALGDPTGPLFQTSRLHPSKYAEKNSIAKILYQFLYYHEGDIRKALDLCEAVVSFKGTSAGWWWFTQKARCLIMLGNPRAAEPHLRTSLMQLAHPDTILLLTRVYVKIDQPLSALDICRIGLEKIKGKA